MARTQARRKASSGTARTTGGHPLLLVAIGIAIGLAAPYGYRYAVERAASPDSALPASPAANPVVPKFDFYTLLPDSEVIVPEREAAIRPGLEMLAMEETAPGDPPNEDPPDGEPAADSTAAVAAVAATVESGASYLLQAGSFRNPDDAESVRVRLLLLDLPVNIERVNSQGDLWHRVLVGPFTSTTEMSSARETLQANAIESIILKRSD